MVSSLRVSKVHHPIDLTFDEEGLRIEGDFNAGKQGNKEVPILHKNLLNKQLYKSQIQRHGVLLYSFTTAQGA
jgi:hypothetical protein